MSRRDTILVAILINAGLLLILFITAMTSNREQELDYVEIKNLKDQNAPLSFDEQREERPLVARKEVEGVLHQLARSKEEFLEEKENQVSAEDSQVEEAILLKDNSTEIAKYVEITVKRGDFLEKIAKENASSVEEIMKINGLPNTRLQIGQILYVPLPSKEEISAHEKELDKGREDAATDAEYYIVKSGDNPWLIAMKHRMKLEDLLKLNNLDEAKARRLNPGDKIRIR